MQINEYQNLAMMTLNKDLTKKEALVNSVMGLNGEAGEVIDLVKKHLFHGHVLNKEELIKELGDVAWYLAEAAYALDIDLETILKLNIEKLKKRYPEGFSTKDSINRKDC
jgi:NTP pyrophosphatase (non-canonical NTP hydrolase)